MAGLFGGLAGAAGFSAGFGSSFNQAQHQQQELQMERQRLQMQQQRDLLARADKQRAELWDRIGEHIAAMRSAGADKTSIMNSIKPFIQPLTRITASSGQDPSLVGPQIGMMLDKPNAYDIAFGKQKQKLDEFKQAQAAGVFNQSNAFDAGGAAPIPFARQDPNTGEGFMTPQGEMPQAPQASSGMSDQQQEDPAAEMERIGHAITLASQQHDPGAVKVLTFRLQQLARQQTGKSDHLYPKKDGTGLYSYDANTRKVQFIPFPGQEGQANQPPSDYEPLYGMPKIGSAQQKVLNDVNVSPEQFDFEAVQVAYGNNQLLVGSGRDKASVQYRRLLNARATDYWRAQGLKPEDANAAKLEFSAMQHGAAKIGAILATMNTALEKARATAPVVLDASKKLPRTDYPAVNSAILSWKENVGNKDAPPFFIALETLAMNYASALGMGNTVITDSRAEHARDLIKKGWSDGQLDSAIKQLLNELDRESQSSRRSLHSFLQSSPTTNSQFNQQGGSTNPADMTDDQLDRAIEEAKRRAGTK